MAITQERWQSCTKAQVDDDDKQMINGHQLRGLVDSESTGGE